MYCAPKTGPPKGVCQFITGGCGHPPVEGAFSALVSLRKEAEGGIVPPPFALRREQVGEAVLGCEPVPADGPALRPEQAAQHPEPLRLRSLAGGQTRSDRGVQTGVVRAQPGEWADVDLTPRRCSVSAQRVKSACSKRSSSDVLPGRRIRTFKA